MDPSSFGTTASRAALYDGFAVVGRALGAGRRLELLDFLNQAPRSVGQLAAEIHQSVANTSQHLQVLVGAGLVVARRDGQHIIYSLSSPSVARLLAVMRELAVETVDEVQDLVRGHLGDRSDLEWISGAELARKLRIGTAVVIDVRSHQDYEAGHIAGAILVPNSELSTFATSVPEHVEVVAYCRGEYCSLADEAIRTLRRLGVRARRLERGYPEWRDYGRPTERRAAASFS